MGEIEEKSSLQDKKRNKTKRILTFEATFISMANSFELTFTNLTNNSDFEKEALALYAFQKNQNLVLKRYLQLTNRYNIPVNSIKDLTFLPVSFFKTHKVSCSNRQEETVFLSSTTSGGSPSRHFVYNLNEYLKHTESCFNFIFKDISSYCHLALLPSYLEREGSSLVSMVQHFIGQSAFAESGFYLHNHQDLVQKLQKNNRKGIPSILWGVSYALLDLSENFNLELPNTMVIETGGMKGRRAEITRKELHEILQKSLKPKAIFSEYGMTEMLSQCYTQGGEKFYCPPSVRVLGRDIQDPFSLVDRGRNKLLNIIDLANKDSCAFLALDDIAHIHSPSEFEILGRSDYSDIRGCNLMVQ